MRRIASSLVHIPEATPQRSNRAQRRAAKAGARTAKAWGPWERRDLSAAMMAQLGTSLGAREGYVNTVLSVQLTREPSAWGEIVHLWIRRHDESIAVSWSEKQRIKDELVGKERVAVEVFPAESRLVDQANMYHLWVMPDGFALPFGLHSKDQT